MSAFSQQRPRPRGRVLRGQHRHRAGHRAPGGGRLHGRQGGPQAQAAARREHRESFSSVSTEILEPS